jgi:hypothetical protein
MSIAALTLDQFLIAFSRYLRNGGLPCRMILPTFQGDLLLVFEAQPDPLQLIWFSQPDVQSGAVVGHIFDRPVAVVNGKAIDFAARILPRLEALIRKAGERAYSQFDRRNRNIMEVPHCAEGLRSLIANLVKPNEPAWGIYTLVEQTDQIEDGFSRFVFAFEDSVSMVKLAFLPEPSDPLNERVLLSTPLGALAILEDTRSAENRQRIVHQIERMFAYQLATGIHAHMNWTDPLPEPEHKQGNDSEADSREVQNKRDTKSLSDSLFEFRDLWDSASDSLFQQWGNEDFFFISMMFSPGVKHLCHGGRECPAGTPPFVDPNDHHVPLPWRLNFAPGQMHQIRMTDVDDHSVIFGGESRLREILDETPDDPESIVIVTSHCEYEYIGDRTNEVSSDYARKRNSTLVHQPSPMPQFVSQTSKLNWWQTIVDRIPATSKQKRTNAINLIGFAPVGDPYLQTLESLLGELGVDVINRFYPIFESAQLTHFPSARLSIIRPWMPVETVIGSLLEARGYPMMRIPAPYGVTGTKRWLDEVCAALEMATPTEFWWENQCARRFPDFAGDKQRSANMHLGFVARAAFVEELFRPDFFFGIDLGELLNDWGCTVSMLIMSNAENDRDATEAFVQSKLNDATVTFFDDWEKVQAVLEADPCRLVYSDIDRNPMLTRAGKVQFSIHDLQLGLDGARYTLRRLLASQELDFYRQYGRYLAPYEDK